MDIENKLDEDFLFYLGFTNTFMNRMCNGDDRERCNAWLQKLCGEKCEGIESKRNRNIYLSSLVLSMQDGKLNDPFTRIPNDVDLSNALEIFGPVQPTIKEPEWLDEVVDAADEEDPAERRKDGRTYLATRTLPGGEGAFAYIAVTLADDEPKWLGGATNVDEHLEQQYRMMVPPVYEMEKILARRKDPAERERVVTFYDALLQNIADELDGHVSCKDNDAITNLTQQLVNDLQSKGEYDELANMPEEKRRAELLIILHDKINIRKDKVTKREEVLDDLEEQLMPHSFFETSLEVQDKFELPATMWEQAINKAPTRKNMNLLQDSYPVQMIETFLELLSNHKEEIAVRLQKRHENLVSQMKKELRKAGEKGRKDLDKAQKSCDQAVALLLEVRKARERQANREKEVKEMKEAAKSDTSRLYEQLRAALFDTQRGVEMEAEKGHHLSTQINMINDQTEAYQHVTDESIKRVEEGNIVLMKNIKKMRTAVKQYENRLEQIQKLMVSAREDGKQQQQQQAMFIF